MTILIMTTKKRIIYRNDKMEIAATIIKQLAVNNRSLDVREPLGGSFFLVSSRHYS